MAEPNSPLNLTFLVGARTNRETRKSLPNNHPLLSSRSVAPLQYTTSSMAQQKPTQPPEVVGHGSSKLFLSWSSFLSPLMSSLWFTGSTSWRLKRNRTGERSIGGDESNH